MNDITYHFNETIEFRDYKDFLKRTDLGSQYPEENFKERIKKLLSNRTLSVTARNKDNILVGICFGLTDFSYFLFISDLGVDRNYENLGIGKKLVNLLQIKAGGEDDITVIVLSNENAVEFYKKCGYRTDTDLLIKPCRVWTEFKL
ncbi:MAG: GNAT family N-acetyltransferase [Candidatus Marinimicrobia bacterium]|jgi:ribosomal protein S18 acetylase RimI-like enzyme|nr:GNAT family N-acetyltransferase [Candidatus Neomarinimicrobiota bacterium]|tara:strand:- start:19 stop:456 length:438 start_codon:yes stop_codon:yes gene_type:complete